MSLVEEMSFFRMCCQLKSARGHTGSIDNPQEVMQLPKLHGSLERSSRALGKFGSVVVLSNSLTQGRDYPNRYYSTFTM